MTFWKYIKIDLIKFFAFWYKGMRSPNAPFKNIFESTVLSDLLVTHSKFVILNRMNEFYTFLYSF